MENNATPAQPDTPAQPATPAAPKGFRWAEEGEDVREVEDLVELVGDANSETDASATPADGDEDLEKLLEQPPPSAPSDAVSILREQMLQDREQYRSDLEALRSEIRAAREQPPPVEPDPDLIEENPAEYRRQLAAYRRHLDSTRHKPEDDQIRQLREELAATRREMKQVLERQNTAESVRSIMGKYAVFSDPDTRQEAAYMLRGMSEAHPEAPFENLCRYVQGKLQRRTTIKKPIHGSDAPRPVPGGQPAVPGQRRRVLVPEPQKPNEHGVFTREQVTKGVDDHLRAAIANNAEQLKEELGLED